MPIILEMPSLSPTMEKGNLVSWCKNEGDEIAIGDVIAEIDTDKATMEVESIYKGVLAKIIVPAGTHDVVVRTPIAVIRQKNDGDEEVQRAVEEVLNGADAKCDAPQIKDAVLISKNLSEPESPVQNFDGIKASPLAKRIANEYGIDISNITGSGPHGRIVKEDVLSVKQMSSNKLRNIPTGPKFVDEPISSMRKVIAEKLTKSKQETPHFYMTASANVSNLLDVRKQINDSGKFDTKITVNDFVMKAVALAMKDEPTVNVAWNNGSMRRFSTVDVSVAVAVENGLITPIILSADMKSICDMSKEIKDLAKKAKEGKLKPEQFIGGGITVSNLGMYGIDSFSSIINPPQGSILSIGPAKKTPAYNDSGELIPAEIMNIGYAVDHRVIDGGNAAKFLEILIKYLENPILLVI